MSKTSKTRQTSKTIKTCYRHFGGCLDTLSQKIKYKKKTFLVKQTLCQDRKTERQKDRKTERQKDRKTERQKDRKTERQKIKTKTFH